MEKWQALDEWPADVEVGNGDLEAAESARIRAVKLRELTSNGNGAVFAPPREWLLTSGSLPACSKGSLRRDMHQMSQAMDTFLGPTESAWRVMPNRVLRPVSEQDWQRSLAGGFCARNVDWMCDWSCCICLGEQLRGVALLPCGHAFHQQCHEQWQMTCFRYWLDFQCAMCRATAPPFVHAFDVLIDVPMDFKFTPWSELQPGVVARDEPTESQERLVAERRRQGPLDAEAVARRRRRLSDHFKGAAPHPEFFEERLIAESPPRAEALPTLLGRSRPPSAWREEMKPSRSAAPPAGGASGVLSDWV